MIWKWRYTRRLMKLLALDFEMAWHSAGATLEMIDHDLTECPLDMAYEEFCCWGES